MDDISKIEQFLDGADYKTCDFTIGGIFMWIDYFRYEYAIVENTLFIKGVLEDDLKTMAFSFPLGEMPLDKAIVGLQAYCDEQNVALNLSAVPEVVLPALRLLGCRSESELVNWSDYLYSAETLATLKGKKMSKKRNHVNSFTRNYPDYCVEEIDANNIADVIVFFESSGCQKYSRTARYEHNQTSLVLHNIGRYGFDGIVMYVDGKVVAFALGEKRGNCMFEHIEKTNHKYGGANEAIASFYARWSIDKYGVEYINREEDAGDEGLRQSKLSYYPVKLLKKYNVEF